MQVNSAMSLEEVFDRLALVRREVVKDNVDLFAARLLLADLYFRRRKTMQIALNLT